MFIYSHDLIQSYLVVQGVESSGVLGAEADVVDRVAHVEACDTIQTFNYVR